TREVRIDPQRALEHRGTHFDEPQYQPSTRTDRDLRRSVPRRLHRSGRRRPLDGTTAGCLRRRAPPPGLDRVRPDPAGIGDRLGHDLTDPVLSEPRSYLRLGLPLDI